jgi:hypothetical protein
MKMGIVYLKFEYSHKAITDYNLYSILHQGRLLSRLVSAKPNKKQYQLNRKATEYFKKGERKGNSQNPLDNIIKPGLRKRRQCRVHTRRKKLQANLCTINPRYVRLPSMLQGIQRNRKSRGVVSHKQMPDDPRRTEILRRDD